MNETKDVEYNVELVGGEEELVGLFPNGGMRKGEDDGHDGEEHEASDAGDGLEEPVDDRGSGVGGEEHFLGHTAEVVDRLSGNVVEVDNVTNGVEEGEEEGRAGHDLMELDVGVEGDVLLDWKVLQLRQEVPGHREEEQGIAERERGR